jgi:hypothetical protein
MRIFFFLLFLPFLKYLSDILRGCFAYPLGFAPLPKGCLLRFLRCGASNPLKYLSDILKRVVASIPFLKYLSDILRGCLLRTAGSEASSPLKYLKDILKRG